MCAGLEDARAAPLLCAASTKHQRDLGVSVQDLVVAPENSMSHPISLSGHRRVVSTSDSSVALLVFLKSCGERAEEQVRD